MKVGFVSSYDASDPGAISGMPFAMCNSLRAHGCTIYPFSPYLGRSRWQKEARSRLARFVPSPAKDFLKKIREMSPKAPPPAMTEEGLYQHTRADATRLSLQVKEKLRGSEFDVLFGCCISAILCDLDVETPIVYFSDTTARLIFESYPELRDQPEGYRRACDEIERSALGRASMVVFATDVARNSAIEHYGVPPDRAFTVPMGANIADKGIEFPPPNNDVPTLESIRLLLTAADPVRKRLDLVIDVVDVLRRQGRAAELDLIGPPTPRATSHPHVRCLGRLSLSREADRRANLGALRRCHLMILPSLGEAFGIAPCEAALLGKPSIVSAAGGLPEVVLDDVTGIVMGMQSNAEDYARAIMELAANPGRYRAMSAAAAARAHDNFTWPRWGDRLMEIMERARSTGRR